MSSKLKAFMEYGESKQQDVVPERMRENFRIADFGIRIAELEKREIKRQKSKFRIKTPDYWLLTPVFLSLTFHFSLAIDSIYQPWYCTHRSVISTLTR